MKQRNEIAVVSGGHSGIGLELSKLLLDGGWDLVLIKRQSSGEEAIHSLQQKWPSAKIVTVDADLANQPELTTAAKQILSFAPSIKALFNNAGVLLGDLSYSPQHVEMHFQVNALAPYALMRLLKPALARAKDAVVVNTSSGALYNTGALKVQDLENPKRLKKLFGAYAQSKLALTTLTNGLADEFSKDKILLRSIEPGATKTKMTASSGMPKLLLWLRPLLFSTPDKAAKHIYSAAFNSALGVQTGIFLAKGRIVKVPADATDAEIQRQVLSLCQSLTGL